MVLPPPEIKLSIINESGKMLLLFCIKKLHICTLTLDSCWTALRPCISSLKLCIFYIGLSLSISFVFLALNNRYRLNPFQTAPPGVARVVFHLMLEILQQVTLVQCQELAHLSLHYSSLTICSGNQLGPLCRQLVQILSLVFYT